MKNWFIAIGLLLGIVSGMVIASAAIYAIIAAGYVEFLFAAAAVPVICLPLYALKQWVDEKEEYDRYRDSYNRYYRGQR